MSDWIWWWWCTVQRNCMRKWLKEKNWSCLFSFRFFVFPSLCVSYCVKKLLRISYSVSKKNKIRKSRYNTLSLSMTRHYRLCLFLLLHLRLLKLKQVTQRATRKRKKVSRAIEKFLTFLLFVFRRLLLGCCKYGFMYYFAGVNWLCEIWTSRKKRESRNEKRFSFLLL